MSDWPVPSPLPSPPSLVRRSAWGMATVVLAEVVTPGSTAEVVAALRDAAARGRTVIPWGAGNSYGDVALNESHVILDLSRMRQIVAWDPTTGRVTCQPGVTLETLWKHILRDGWWPKVVSGTMKTTLGGLVAANAHGKNNWKHGPIGEAVQAFTLVTPTGEVREVDRTSDPDLFHAAIGGFGWLGVFTSITLQTTRIHSGRLQVLPLCAADLGEMFRTFERCLAEDWDYVVGWIDGFARGSALGRGQIHAARYLDEGEDPQGRETLDLSRQELPPRLFGVIPRRWMWRLARPFANRLGMRLVNWARYTWMRWRKDDVRHLEEHARFNFLLDYVPDWKRVYEPGGLIQIQFFLPHAVAEDTFRRVLGMCQEIGLEPWLIVMKRHREDPFWLSHAVDGYSFACDFPVTEARRGDLWRLARRFNALVAEVGGRFYFAKDSVVDPDSAERAWGPETLGRFFALKRRLDPDGLLQSNLFRRVFGDRWRALADAWEARTDAEAVAPEPSTSEAASR